MFKIMLSSGHGTEKLFADGLSEEEAVRICEEYNWEYQINGEGFVWDMIIEEDD